jgi:nicotinamide mononucleotide transporter
MDRAWEAAANLFNAAAIVLAARNNVHTWWTSLVGCTLFAYVFFAAKLYADVTLQVFFIGASIVGWWRWVGGDHGAPLPIRRTPREHMAGMAAAAVVVALAYGGLLQQFTDAYAPFLDSVILTFSVLGQFLLVGRRIENWWCWLIVNSVAVPVYFSRGLYITSALYVGFWVNAIVALVHWRRLLRRSDAPMPPSAS